MTSPTDGAGQGTAGIDGHRHADGAGDFEHAAIDGDRAGISAAVGERVIAAVEPHVSRNGAGIDEGVTRPHKLHRVSAGSGCAEGAGIDEDIPRAQKLRRVSAGSGCAECAGIGEGVVVALRQESDAVCS